MTGGATSSIRDARLEDAPAIARIHVECWRHAYRGLVPQSLLDSLSVEARKAQWRRVLGEDDAAPARGATLVSADESGEVSGFAQTGVLQDGSDDPATGELYAIYLDPKAIGTGIGRELLGAATERLRAAGFAHAQLDVLPGNARAIRVYEAAGWRASGAPWDVQHGEHVLPHQRYTRDL
ncbi:MAG: GCN5-related N-acetyltransferase [Thermoleophilia bacterium]|nr:GCN5-related N-acetyltransferase [Thermoleophilia bacterium]